MSRWFPVTLALLAACPVAAGERRDASNSEQLADVIAKIPIERVQTTTDARERQRGEGRPVMLIQGQPGYVYRDMASFRDHPIYGAWVDQPHAQGRADVDGCVVVSFEILADGKTDQFEIVTADPPKLFDKLALRALFVTEFEPPKARLGGPAPRYQRAVWFLIARPFRREGSPRLNDDIEEDRNKRREARRAACESKAS